MNSDGLFIINLGVGILLLCGNIIIGLIAYAARQTVDRVRGETKALDIDIDRLQHGLDACEVNQRQDARNLEEWKLKYSEDRSPLVSRVSTIEGIVSKLDALSLDVRTLLIQLPVLSQTVTMLDKRLTTLEQQGGRSHP